MANNYYNFTIPSFNSSSGTDWDSFQTIVDDNTDYIMNKTYRLYWLKAISKMPIRALERALKLRKIKFTTSDATSVKRFKLRSFVSSFANKGLADTYIDLAFSITGIRGTLSISVDGWTWGESAWAPGEDSRWGGIGVASIYNVYFNVKTTDEGELDLIEALLLEKTNRPAFYQIILIDDDQNILRVVG
ncbi:MAG: hypothetical protein GY853_01915 [PVC group bacterium]|nr:hypothetical protein [PVC group bacterium]